MQTRTLALLAGVGTVISAVTLRAVRRRRAARREAAADTDWQSELAESRNHVVEAASHARSAGEGAADVVRKNVRA